MMYVACEYQGQLRWCVEFVNDSVGKTVAVGLGQVEAHERAAALNAADWVSFDIHGNASPMSSAGPCSKCGSGETWRVGGAMGGSPRTCACHSCNSYFSHGGVGAAVSA